MNTGTRTRLEALHTSLLCREHALMAEVGAVAAARRAGDLGPEVHDQKDDAARRGGDVVEAAEMRRDLDELAGIRAALRRLDAGVYGDCADCGGPIPLERLLLQPAAERCVACQAALEALRRA